MKIDKFLSPKKLIPVGLAFIGLAQLVLSGKQQEYERESIKKEILEELKNEQHAD